MLHRCIGILQTPTLFSSDTNDQRLLMVSTGRLRLVRSILSKNRDRHSFAIKSGKRTIVVIAGLASIGRSATDMHPATVAGISVHSTTG